MTNRGELPTLLSNGASFLLVALAGVVVSSLLAYRFGAMVVGQFNLLAAVQLVLSQLAACGVHLACLHHLSVVERPGSRWAEGARAGLLLAIGTAASTAVVAAVLARPLEGLFESAGLAAGIVWVALGGGLFGVNKVMFSLLTAAGRLHALAGCQALRPAGWLAGAAILLQGDQAGARELGILLAAAELLCFCGAAAAIAPMLRRNGPPGAGLSRWLAPLWSFGWRAMPSNLLIDLNTRIDVLVLGVFASDSAVGIYSFAALLAEGVFQIGAVFRTVISRHLVAVLHAQDAAGIDRLKRAAGKGSFGLTLLAAIAVAVLFVPALRVFGLDPSLEAGVPSLLLLLGGVVAVSFHSPFWMTLALGGQPAAHTRLMLLLLAVTTVLNLVLVPAFGGLGAAFGSAASLALFPFFLCSAVHARLGVRL